MPFPIPSGLPCALELGTPGLSVLLWVGVTKPPAPLPVLVASSACSSRSRAGDAGVVHNLLFLLRPPPWGLAPLAVGGGGRGALRDSRRGPRCHSAVAHIPLPCAEGGSTCSGQTWGLYVGHLPLPLCRLWGELGPQHPAEPSGVEPPLSGVGSGGGPEPSPPQLAEGSLLPPLLSGALGSHESQTGKGEGQ